MYAVPLGYGQPQAIAEILRNWAAKAIAIGMLCKEASAMH